eukprot:1291718-Amphidinium_carterae.1
MWTQATKTEGSGESLSKNALFCWLFEPFEHHPHTSLRLMGAMRSLCRDEGGAKYVGQWKGTMRHGHGIITQPDGSRYEGSVAAMRGHESQRALQKNLPIRTKLIAVLVSPATQPKAKLHNFDTKFTQLSVEQR